MGFYYSFWLVIKKNSQYDIDKQQFGFDRDGVSLIHIPYIVYIIVIRKPARNKYNTEITISFVVSALRTERAVMMNRRFLFSIYSEAYR